jgi:Cft2 family RNA processing exonuclease
MFQLSAGIEPQRLSCQVEKFNFSGHASRETLRAYANALRPKKIILVHGDAAAVEWFRATLSADLPGTEVITPTPGVALEL